MMTTADHKHVRIDIAKLNIATVEIFVIFQRKYLANEKVSGITNDSS